MASLAGRYDEEADAPSFEVMPAGEYNLELTEAEIKATKDGKGELLKHTIRVIDGPYEGKLIFSNFNLQNANPQTMKMGNEAFKALRDVIDVPKPEDTDELCFKSFAGIVKVIPKKGEYDEKNDVDWNKTHKLWKAGSTLPANDNEPPADKSTARTTKNGGAASAANDNVPAAAGAKKPWPKKAAA
jgi:hypothetical protein